MPVALPSKPPRSRCASWLLLLPLAHPALAGTAGPSAAGLVYTDSSDGDGPSSPWLDATDGTALPLADDDSAVIDLPFAFHVDGTAYTTATVSSNGVLYFDGVGPDGTTTDPIGACPDTTTYTGISAFADDLSAGTVYTTTYGRYPDRTFVVSWDDVRPVGSPESGRVQIWLLERRDEAVIVLDDTDFGDPAHDGGASAYIGVSVSSGGTAAGLAYACAGGASSGTTVWFGDEQGRPARAEIRSDELEDPWTGDADFAYAGTSLATGDVNGDSVDDALVGAKDRGKGQAYMLIRPYTPNTLDNAPAIFDGSATYDGFGSAVLLDDLDGDGLGDVTIAAPDNDDAGANKGKVYAWLGGGWNGEFAASTASFTATGDASDRPVAGTSLAGAGDVDGDGYTDLLVGAPDSDLGATNAGAVALYLGPLASGTGVADAWFTSSSSGDRFGTQVTTGDLDGNGSSEVIIAATQSDLGAADAGAIYVFAGGSWSGTADAASNADCVWTDTTAADRFGTAVLAADIDGSGALDLIGGAPLGNGTGPDAGYVWVLYDPSLGSCGTTTALADGTINGVRSANNFGAELAAGDIDGDGVDDLIASAPNATTDSSGGGSAYVFTTAPTGSISARSAQHTMLGEATAGALGTDLAVARDGDAWPTLLTTAPYAGVHGTAQGALYAWGYTPDFLDEDGDGFVDARVGGNDCDDLNPDAFPGGLDLPDDSVDGDCDGWTDGVVVVRSTVDAFDWDLNDLGCAACDGAPHTFDFEPYGIGAGISGYTVDGTTLSFTPRVYAEDEVQGTWPDGTRAAQFVPDSLGTLTLQFSSPVDAISFLLLDAKDDFLLTATGTTGSLSYTFSESADDRAGGVYHGYSFAFPVDTITLRPLGGDGIGLDTIGVLYSAETDHDGDGYTEADSPADCDDTRAWVNPGAREELGDGIDNNCDGIIDAGDVVTYDDEAAWLLGSDVVTEATVDFEVLTGGESLTTQYVDLGVQFLAGALGGADADGTAAHDTMAAVDSGGTLTIYFKEAQPAAGLDRKSVV